MHVVGCGVEILYQFHREADKRVDAAHYLQDILEGGEADHGAHVTL